MQAARPGAIAVNEMNAAMPGNRVYIAIKRASAGTTHMEQKAEASSYATHRRR